MECPLFHYRAILMLHDITSGNDNIILKEENEFLISHVYQNNLQGM